MSEDQQMEAREIESILALIERQGRHRRRQAWIMSAVCLLMAGMGLAALLWPR